MARLPNVGGDDGTWGDVLNDFLVQSHNADGALKSGSVGAAQLKPGSVTDEAISNGAVSALKITDGAIGSAQLSNGAIEEAHLASELKTKLNAGIADGAVTTVKLSDDAVTATKLADGSVTSAALADAAVPVSKLAGAGEPNGVAVLEGTGKLPTGAIPMLAVASSPEVSAAIVAPPGAARMNAASAPNGIPMAMSETGQPVTSFGNTPLTVTGGAITHAPIPGAPATNVAGYLQTRTKSGGKAKLIWAWVVAEPTTNTGLALVIPQAAWANGQLGPAQVHHVEYPSGSWHTSVWTGATESPKYFPDAYAGAWNDSKPHLIAVLVDESEGSVSVIHPDGSINVSSPGAIDWSKISEYGVIESYRSTNTVGDPAVPIKILSWGVSDVSDFARLKSMGIPDYRDIGRALSRATSDARARAMQYRPSAATDYTAPTSSSDVDATNISLTFTAPLSGRVTITAETFVKITSASASYLQDIGLTRDGTPVSGAGIQRVHVGSCDEKKVVSWYVTGLTPSSTYVATLRHFCTVADTAIVRVHAGNGYFAHLRMLPC